MDPAQPTRRADWLRRAGPPLFVFIITFAALARALSNQLISWDDQSTLIENTAYRGLDFDHLRWMFTTFLMGPYQPLSWLSYAVDYKFWGVDPRGFHLTNVLLHAATAVALYRLLLQLMNAAGQPADGIARTIAVTASLFFAIHPLRVESVAWATERRDVLSGLIAALTLSAYLSYVAAPRGRTRRYAWTLLLFVLALLAKSIAMTLPITLLILDVWPLRRFRRPLAPVLIEKIPFVLAAVAAAVLAVIGQQKAGAIGDLEHLSPAARLAISSFATCFYVWKTICPMNLSPMYELPARLDPYSSRYLLCAAAILFVTILAFRARRHAPVVLAALICYVVTLSPVIGLLHVGKQIAADRYSYLPSFAFSALLVAACIWIVRNRAMLVRPTLVTAGLMLAALFGLTVRQVGFWHDSDRLWQRALIVNPDCAFAHYNISILMQERGDLPHAIEHAAAAVRLRPDVTDARWNYGVILAQAGRHAEALGYLNQGPGGHAPTADDLFYYGAALVRAGSDAAALGVFEKILALAPDHPRATLALGLLHARAGEVEKARPYLDRALHAAPPVEGSYDDAATAWIMGRRPREAINVLREAVRQFPNSSGPALRLSWLLATHPRTDVRNGAEALTLAQRAVSLTNGREPRPQAALAAAMAELRRFPEARDAMQRAIQLARQANDAALANDLKQMDDELAAGRPLRIAPSADIRRGT